MLTFLASSLSVRRVVLYFLRAFSCTLRNPFSASFSIKRFWIRASFFSFIASIYRRCSWRTCWHLCEVMMHCSHYVTGVVWAKASADGGF